MVAGLASAAALPIGMCGLYAIWRWAREPDGAGRLLFGCTMLVSAVGLLGVARHASAERLVFTVLGVYLACGLIWAWRDDGLSPARWNPGETAVAALAVGLLAAAAFDVR